MNKPRLTEDQRNEIVQKYVAGASTETLATEYDVMAKTIRKILNKADVMRPKSEDLTGQKFEMLTALKKVNEEDDKEFWLCQCDCGEQKIFERKNIKRTKSCGCLRVEMGGRNKIDILGQRFDCLEVIAKAESIDRNSAWFCRCDCGNEKVINYISLTTGKSKTCGCRINRFPNNDPKLSSAKSVFTDKYSDGDLTFDEFVELSQKNCFYCDVTPNNSTNRLDSKCRNERRGRENQFAGEKGTFVYNGLDRIDSNLSHNKNNVVTSCYPCNWAKLDLTSDEFKSLIIRIYNHWASK